MPYCPDCGVRSEKGAPACSSCGLVFSADSLQAESLQTESSEKETKFDESERRQSLPRHSANLADSQNRPVTENRGIEEDLSYVMRDSQLGKGTIKPYSVELGVDGYHFKFEEPPRRMSKPEPSKEKSAEFRVTDTDIDRINQLNYNSSDINPDMLLDTNNSLDDKANETVSEVPSDKTGRGEAEDKLTEAVDLESDVVPGELSPETESGDLIGPAEKEVDETTEVPPAIETPEIPETPETDLAAEPETIEDKTLMVSDEEPMHTAAEDEKSEASEPETQSEGTPVKVLWKGNRSFLGIPLSEQYQVTNRSIIVDKPKSGRHFEYALTSVATLNVKQTWVDKLLGTGNLTVKVRAVTDTIAVELKGIGDPVRVLKIIADLISSGYNRSHG